MPSALERAVAANRAALLAREQQATLALLQAYTPARERLVQRIDALVTALQAKGELTPTELLKWDRAQTLFAQIDEEVTRLAALANQEIIGSQGEMVAMAGEHAKGLALVQVSDIANLVAAVDTAWNQLTPSNVEALVGRMADGSPLNATLAQFGGEAQREITERLLSAVALNTNPRDTAAELANVVDAQRWKLLRIARTEQLNAYRTATLQNYQANADIVDGWVWISAHQTRTCLACLSLDGQVFPLSVDFQPSHANCRCSSLAVVKGVPLPAHQTGEEWFHAQSDATQREMLPTSMWDEFQNGDVQLSDFRQLETDPQWGNSYHEATITEARQNAGRRERMAA